jgi:hypothetical protein
MTATPATSVRGVLFRENEWVTLEQTAAVRVFAQILRLVDTPDLRAHGITSTLTLYCDDRAPSAENGLRLNTCLQQATGVEFYGSAILMACEPIGNDYIERRTEVYEDVLSEDLSTLRSSVRLYYELRRAYAEFNRPLDGPAPCC